jgi:hypothetical protein
VFSRLQKYLPGTSYCTGFLIDSAAAVVRALQMDDLDTANVIIAQNGGSDELNALRSPWPGWWSGRHSTPRYGTWNGS